MDKQVWIVFSKSEALEGCSIDVDGCDFYFAEAYVPIDGEPGLTSFDSILSRVKQSLLDDKLVLADVSKCLRYVREEWQADSEVHALAAQALSSGATTFSSFRSEEIENQTPFLVGRPLLNSCSSVKF